MALAEAWQVRQQDVREVDRLINECCELGEEPYAWQFHLVLGLRRLLGFQIATTGMTDLPLGEMTFQSIRGAVDFGWSSPKHRAYCGEFWMSNSFRQDPLYSEQVKQPGSVVTHRWQDLVTSRTWYRSEPLNRYYRVAEQLHLMSCGVHASPESGVRTMFVNVLRPTGDKAFSERDRDTFDLAMRQVRGLLGVKLMPFGQSRPPGLTPRMRQVMALLLRGYAEKEVAAVLGVSFHSVHNHVKELHRRLEVHSRDELLRVIRSLFATPAHAPPPLSPRLEQTRSLLLKDYSERAIAIELGISSHTIHDYVKEIYRRFDVHCRAQLAFKCALWE
ncbi:MAG: LuxR family transcriptional regulator [Lentisphaerae bacterium]|nr:LuxR family transcriptional regulator [Lentisphaerota bacterium]